MHLITDVIYGNPVKRDDILLFIRILVYRLAGEINYLIILLLWKI
jgi:hypothetical protein